ncbi:ankyrin repeat-containing domain protein, partial [Linnemannia elongata]
EHLEELIECARYGELEEIQAVVQTSGPEKAKVLLSHKGDYGKTPLHMAAANGHLDVVEYLISIISPEAVNIQNDQGNTALHWAATNGHAKVVETLI